MMLQEIQAGLARGEAAITKRRHELYQRRKAIKGSSNPPAHQEGELKKLERELRIAQGLRCRLQTIEGHLADLALELVEEPSRVLTKRSEDEFWAQFSL